MECQYSKMTLLFFQNFSTLTPFLIFFNDFKRGARHNSNCALQPGYHGGQSCLPLTWEFYLQNKLLDMLHLFTVQGVKLIFFEKVTPFCYTNMWSILHIRQTRCMSDLPTKQGRVKSICSVAQKQMHYQCSSL